MDKIAESTRLRLDFGFSNPGRYRKSGTIPNKANGGIASVSTGASFDSSRLKWNLKPRVEV